MSPCSNVCRPGRRNGAIDLTKMFSGSSSGWNRLPRINLGPRHFPLPDSTTTGRLIRHWRRFITAFENRVVQIRSVRLAGIEPHYYAGFLRIDFHRAHALDFQQRLAQSTHAFLAIVAFSRDLDGFDDGVISALRIKWIARFGFVRSGWVHQLWNVRRGLSGRKFARNRFEDAPDIFGENFLAGRIWMNVIGLIQ